LTGFTGLFRIVFILFQFPDETGKTQSASSGKPISLVNTMKIYIFL
jgi:hypothetical protein